MEQPAASQYEFEWLTLADPALFGEGQCLRHACLFDVWLDSGGSRVYKFKQQEHHEKLEKWRRAQFYKWFDKLTMEQVERLLG